MEISASRYRPIALQRDWIAATVYREGYSGASSLQQIGEVRAAV
jgi:hypothetical protein